jgi:hypothetical protein
MDNKHRDMRFRFASILLSSSCQKIDFWCGGLHVTGAGLARVARAISNTNKRVQSVNIRIEDPGEGAAAAYEYWTDTIVVPKRSWAASDAFEQLALVHECVHVLRDSHGQRLTYEGRKYVPRASTDEVAAYVGGCLFNVYQQRQCGNKALDKPAWLASRKSPVHAAAYEVALRQADKPAGSPIDRDDLSTLFKLHVSSYRARKKTTAPRLYAWDGISLPRA